MQVWAADKLKKKDGDSELQSGELKTECPLHIRGIIAQEDNAIQHSISTFRLYQVAGRSFGWQSECTMSVLCLLIGFLLYCARSDDNWKIPLLRTRMRQCTWQFGRQTSSNRKSPWYAAPPQKKQQSPVVCAAVAYALWLMCLTGQFLEDLETVISTGQPY